MHLWLIVGALAALALLPLAATSASIMHRLLGPALWGRIHKLVYAAATLALVHYAMARGFTRIEVGVDILLIGAALLWRKVGPKPRRPPLSGASSPSPAPPG
jgi:sulfoxide reductase heme-binding subunit YedZ